MSLDFRKEIANRLNDRLERMRKERWKRSATIVTEWLMDRATKKPVEDLPKRIEEFTKRIYKMCEDMRVEFDKGAFVVRVNGSAEQTYKMLRLGTDWFEPNADIDEQIMAGLDEQFGS